jgi:hypothetical protein
MLPATCCQLLPWCKAVFIRCLGFQYYSVLGMKLRQIAPEVLQKVRNVCYYRFAICQERNCVHFEHLLHLYRASHVRFISEFLLYATKNTNYADHLIPFIMCFNLVIKVCNLAKNVKKIFLLETR